MGEYAVRLAQRDECAAIEACVRDAYAKYIPRMGRPPAPMLADYLALIARGVVYVLYEPNDEDLCGVIALWPSDGAMFVENVALHLHAQGRGLGRRLMSFAEEQARAAGLREVRLYTNEAMTENLAFYAHLGFQETDRRLEDGYRRVFMRKPL